MKLFFCDVETTGTDPARHALVQLSGIVEIDGREVEQVDLKMAPFPGAEFDARAMETNGLTEEQVKGWADGIYAHADLTRLLGRYVNKFDRCDKFFFVGFNATFDDRFARDWFRRCGDRYYGSFFHWPPIDVAVLAAACFMERRVSFPNFKLMTVARELGISIDEGQAHDALYDIRVTKQVFDLLRGRLAAG